MTDYVTTDQANKRAAIRRRKLENLAWWGAVIGSSCLFVGTLATGSYYSSKNRCHVIADGMGVAFRYDGSVGCRVNVGGKFIPLDNVKVVVESK